MKATVLLLLMAGGLATSTALHLDARRQLKDARASTQRQAEEIQALRIANQQMEQQSNELERVRQDARDVLRLRGETAQLRRELAQRDLPRSITPTNQPPESMEKQIAIKTTFLSMPASHSPGGAIGFLTSDQLKTVSQSFEAVEGAITLGGPRVTTLSGQRAQVTIGQAVPLGVGGALTNVGLIFDVFPTCALDTTGVDLNFDAQVRRLKEVSDGEFRVEAMSVTNSIRVPNGQTLVVSHRFPSTGPWLKSDATVDWNQPRTLVMFITPTVVDATGRPTAENLQPVLPENNALAPMAEASPTVVPLAAHPEP